MQSVMATCGSEEGEISAAAQLSAMFPDLEWEVSLDLIFILRTCCPINFTKTQAVAVRR